jgi:hypothetical protein
MYICIETQLTVVHREQQQCFVLRIKYTAEIAAATQVPTKYITENVLLG